MDDAVAAASIAKVRTICARLPECTVEGDQHKIAVRGRTMAWHTVDHHGDGRVSLAVKAPRGENSALAAADLLLESYRLSAPKTLVKLLDE